MTTKASLSRIVVIITALFAALSGIYLLAGGIWLATMGGSLYYIIAGVVLLVTAFLLYRRRASALLLYAVYLLATTIWGLWEVGSDFWALTPRLDVTFFLGLWILLPIVYNHMSVKNAFARGALAVSLLFTVAVLVYSVFNDPQEINGTLPAADNAPVQSTPGVADGDWPAYGRTQGGTRYSPLKQINDKNVGELKQAWSFQTGDVKTANDPGEITDEVTPIKIRDTLYLCTPHQKLFALDAATGKQKWVFDPQLKQNPTFQHVTCRGVSYYETPAAAESNATNGAAPALCSRRVILPVNDGRMFALDAETGARCPEFGNNGELNLQSNMPYPVAGHYEPTSPPIITKSVIIMAGAITDNYSTTEPSGVIRGFDVNTGKLLWAFDSGAKDPNKIPGEGENYTPNSPNSWAPAAYDANLDIVYLPMGVQTPDIWGGNRTPESERYASSLLALNATTGKLVWNYQTVHHDLWDMDVPAQPTLADINDKNGNKVPVIYVPTKTGNIFVLDRRDGKLVVPAPEKPVPQGAAKGDHTSPTQPFSDLTFRPSAKLTGADMWGATIYDQLMCRVMFHRLRYEGTFTPPSEQGTLVFPGNLGMFEWGGISVDTDRQVAIANPIALPFTSKLVPRGPGNPMQPPKDDAGGSGTESGIQPQYGVPYGVELNAFLSPLGFPCKQPSWGYISGVDLKTNDIVWKKRIGTVRDSSPVPLPFKMGMPMLGAPTSTAGNVFFIAATADNYLRAFNMSNGDQLWQARLPAGGQATPMTYEVNGKQYVVIAAGGHGSFGTKLGDYIVAYALPDDAKK